MQNLFNNIYKNKTVMVTGHTGFKGSWLSFWLEKLGANVIGYSLEAPTIPNHFSLLNLKTKSIIADIKDQKTLNNSFNKYKPDIIFHLAAQPLVRLSYKEPLMTYETNVIGTLNVLQASKLSNVKAIVNITSDKAYENKEWIWGYKEIDKLGGYDPYSASKACADILTSSFRSSFLNPKEYGTNHNTLLSTCRAGNVIGGGDWAQDRLMSNIAILTSQNKPIQIRNPKATRPWQHVLESLSGYLHLGQKLLEKKVEFAQDWNFGPSDEENLNVEDAVNISKKYWNEIRYEIEIEKNQPHEATLLKLDCSKAHTKLKWKSVWSAEKTFEKTINWYKNYYKNNVISTCENLQEYIKDAKDKQIEWTK